MRLPPLDKSGGGKSFTSILDWLVLLLTFFLELAPNLPRATQYGMIRFVKNKQQEPIAQSVEQQTFNLRVLGSSPSGLTLICEILIQILLASPLNLEGFSG